MSAKEQEELDAALVRARERMHARRLKEYALVNTIDNLAGRDAFCNMENLIEEVVKFLPDDKLEDILDQIERSQREYALITSVRSLTGKDAFRDAENLVKAMVRLLPDRELDLILENLAEGKYEPED